MNRILSTFGIIMLSSVGCVVQQGQPRQATRTQPTPFSDKNQSPAEFMTNRTSVLENRYLLVPIGMESDSGKTIGFTFSRSNSGSAWSGGSFFGELDDASMCVNLEVIDVAGNQHHRLFDGDVAVVGWKYATVGVSARHRPIEQTDTKASAFPNLLFILARTEDSNKDNVLDLADDLIAYSYALEDKKLNRLSPPGFDVDWMDTDGRQVVMHQRELVSPFQLSTYACDPRTGAGRFVAERLEP